MFGGGGQLKGRGWGRGPAMDRQLDRQPDGHCRVTCRVAPCEQQGATKNCFDLQVPRGENHVAEQHPRPDEEEEETPLEGVPVMNDVTGAPAQSDHRLDYLDLESSVAHMSMNNTTAAMASTSSGARPKTGLIKSYNR